MKIVMSAVLALFLIGCGDGSKKEIQGAESKVPVASEVKAKVAEAPKADESAIEEVIEEDSAKAQEYEKTSVELISKEAKEVAAPVVAEVKEVVAETEKVVTPAVAEVKSSNVDGIFKVCATCHGVNAEKSALGKSKVIKGWPAEKIAAAINGYKDGTYGGTMKGVMKNQVAKLSPEDIKALSEHISKL